jgi:hypothetical protein
MTFPNPLAADDPLDAATLNRAFNALYEGDTSNNAIYTATLFPDEGVVLNGNDIALTLHGSIDEVYGHQSASAINDEWRHGAFLSADTYTLVIRVIKSSSSGILKISIDDVIVATIDLYNGSDAVSNQTQASIVLTAGWHTIKGLVDSKNASSSGYNANWIKMFLRGESVL